MCKVELTGPVALELLAPYFREAGYSVRDPGRETLESFAPDYVYDVTAHDEVLAHEIENFRDARLATLAGTPYSLDGIRAIVEEFTWETLRSPRKVLAVDADNTLWKGILSEDGPEALVPYGEFQAGLQSLADAGVVLVLLSKNDPGSIITDPRAAGASGVGGVVLEKCPVLTSFALAKVNWAPKPGNLLEACRELNLDVGSVVFVDDNPHERAQMAAHLPGVAVAPFPAELMRPQQFLRRLQEYFFGGVGSTAEDRLRVRDYRANALRRDLMGRDDYLDALELGVVVSVANEGDLDRLAQMADKTNQFNATTLRRTREEFAAILADASRRVYVFRTRDRFGEQGIVCYVVLDLIAGRITDFVMSCRAMGRTLECFVYDYVVRSLGREPIIDFVPTAKNRPFADFYAALPSHAATHYRQLA